MTRPFHRSGGSDSKMQLLRGSFNHSLLRVNRRKPDNLFKAFGQRKVAIDRTHSKNFNKEHLNASNSTSYVSSPFQYFPHQKIRSNIPSLPPITQQICSVGTLLLGCITTITDVEMIVSLPNGLFGSVTALSISDVYNNIVKQALLHNSQEVTPLHDLFHVGDFVAAYVLETPEADKNIKLSLKPNDIHKRLLDSNIVKGDSLIGCVSSIEDNGYQIDLGFETVSGFLAKGDEEQLSVASLVTCKITNTTTNVMKVSLYHPLKNKKVELTTPPVRIIPGVIITFTVSKVDNGLYGVYVDFKVLVHPSHMSPDSRQYTAGTEVQGCVIYNNQNTKKLYISLLPHLFPDPVRKKPSLCRLYEGKMIRGLQLVTAQHDRLILTTHKGWNLVAMFCDNGIEKANGIENEFGKTISNRGTILSVNLMDNVAKVKLKRKKQKKITKTRKQDLDQAQPSLDQTRERCLKRQRVSCTPKPVMMSVGFTFDDAFHLPKSKDVAESSGDEDADIKPKKKKNKKNLKTQQLEEEKILYEAERQLASTNEAPQTADAFDRLVLQSPNSSVIWLRYMAFHLESANVDAARAIAEKAIQTIAYREEQEKLNVWIAYLNLENMYGTPESINNLLHKAIRYNDPWKIYIQLLNIYTQSAKIDEGEQLLTTIMKKFKRDKRAWLEFASFYYMNGRPEAGLKLLPRALNSLDKFHHIEVINKVSQLECQHGNLEVGKSMFEKLLLTYPRRSDLWSVYIDIVIKAGQIKEARQIFERLTSMKLPSKNMKFFFKKFLDFETQHGTTENLELVKQLAVNYVDKNQETK